MAMSYTSLVAAKGTPSAVATWVNYSLLDVSTIVDEAQSLIFASLRCREMMTDFLFTLPVGGSFIPLPARFLDPIGRIFCPGVTQYIRHKDANFIETTRNYTESSGTLPVTPFTTVNGSNIVTVNLPGHGFSQASIIYLTDTTNFNGITNGINGTFNITSIVDVNDFTIDITVLGTTPTASGVGGGAAVPYVCDNLVAAFPQWYGIWNEKIYFDAAFVQTMLCRLQYYQSLPLLSATNQSNFLTTRYPQLLRIACMASAADFMKDDTEYQKQYGKLQAILGQIAVENDGMLRGMELDTETP
jgi:hypothetical protein